MSVSQTEQDKNLTSSLLSGLGHRAEPPTQADVERKATQLAEIFGYEGDLKNIIDEAMIAVDTRTGAGVSLIDTEAKHDEEWVRNREITWTYSDAYEQPLKLDKSHRAAVQAVSDADTKIPG